MGPSGICPGMALPLLLVASKNLKVSPVAEDTTSFKHRTWRDPLRTESLLPVDYLS